VSGRRRRRRRRRIRIRRRRRRILSTLEKCYVRNHGLIQYIARLS
jgi:hypothetical protein